MDFGQQQSTSAQTELFAEVPKGRVHNDLKKEEKPYEKDSDSIIEDENNNVNSKVLLNTLSPQVAKNEKTKRVHKYILIALLSLFLILQFITVRELSISVIKYAITEVANVNIVKILLGFVSGYITSVIIELIAILNYIVKNVFDTSIADLIKLFKETKENN